MSQKTLTFSSVFKCLSFSSVKPVQNESYYFWAQSYTYVFRQNIVNGVKRKICGERSRRSVCCATNNNEVIAAGADLEWDEALSFSLPPPA